jgi:hypothetical protein
MDIRDPQPNQVPAQTPPPEPRTSATPLKPAGPSAPILEVMPQNPKELSKPSAFVPHIDPYREAPTVEKNNTIPIKIESAPIATKAPATAPAPVNLPGKEADHETIGWSSGPKAAEAFKAQAAPDPTGLQNTIERNFNRYLGPTPGVTQQPPQRVSQAPDDGLERLRTYEGDVADAIKAQNASVVKIAIAEQKKQNKKAITFDSTPAKPKRNNLVMGLSIGLIVAGVLVLAGAYVYLFLIPKSAPVATLNSDLLISSDSEKEVDISSLSDPDIESKIQAAEDPNLGAGAIEHMYFEQSVAGAKSSITAQQFFGLLGIHAPAAMIRALGSDFSFGFQNTGTGTLQPFLIVTPQSFDTVYAGMLQWEPTMYDDLQPMLNSKSASSTPKSQFEDAVIKNNDTRVLHDTSGNTLIIYSFPDDQHLIITTNQQTLEELFTRLTTAAKIVQ